MVQSKMFLNIKLISDSKSILNLHSVVREGLTFWREIYQ